MLDMNCDQKICETDLFTFMETHKEHSFFEQVLVFDMQDIVKTFEERNEFLRKGDQTMDLTDEKAPRIKDLQQYLDTTQARIKQRKEVQ